MRWHAFASDKQIAIRFADDNLQSQCLNFSTRFQPTEYGQLAF